MASCRSSRLVTEAATREEVTATREAVRDRELVADTTKVYDTVRVTIMQRPGELPDTMQSRSIRVERVRERDSVSEERHEVSEKEEVRETEELTAPLFSRREKAMVVAIVIEAVMLAAALLANGRKRKDKTK